MKLLLLAIFISTAAALSEPEVNNGARSAIISAGIRRWIEDMRLSLPCGFPDRDIPPMVPLLVERRLLNVDLLNLAGLGYMTNSRIDGLNTFIIDVMNFNLIFMHIDFTFVFPTITGEGQFEDFIGRVMDNCVVYGNGRYWLRAHGVAYSGRAQLTIRNGFVEMSSLQSSLTVQSFESNIGYFLGTAAESLNCNRQLEQNFPAIIAQNQPRINQFISDILVPRANAVINTMTLADMLDMIMNPAVRPPCP